MTSTTPPAARSISHRLTGISDRRQRRRSAGLASIELGYVTGVTILDGTGDNAYDAQSSPSKNFFYISGHFGDSLSGPAASQVQLNLFGRPLAPIPVHL